MASDIGSDVLEYMNEMDVNELMFRNPDAEALVFIRCVSDSGQASLCCESRNRVSSEAGAAIDVTHDFFQRIWRRVAAPLLLRE